MSDEFDDFAEPIEETARPKTSGIGFACRAPALNSVELALLEVQMMDPILHRQMIFTEDGETEAPQPPDDDPDLAELRPKLAADYQRHIALARSLGPDATWNDYRNACRMNGMRPIHHSDDKGSKS